MPNTHHAHHAHSAPHHHVSDDTSFAAFMRKNRRNLFFCGVLILLGVTGKSVWDLWLRLSYEMHGPYTWDSPVYWAIGRGILNGLLPYKDLFDIKPPGIFLLSAASLWFSKDMFVGSLLQVLVLAGIPLLFVLLAGSLHHAKKFSSPLIVLFSFILGTLLALFTAERSGEFQVESFGSFFAAAYGAVIIYRQQKMTWPWMGIASLCLLCTIGLKEPFFLTALASSFLVCTNIRSWIRSFLIPFLVAAALGMFFLFVSGYLVPYFTLYLHEIFGHHVGSSDSVFQRGLEFKRVYDDLGGYTPLLGPVILGLLASFLWHRVLQIHTVWKKIASVILSVLSLYLTIIAVGIGGEFFNHHYVFAVPLYITLGFLFVRDGLTKYTGKADIIRFILTASVIVTTLIATIQQPHFDYEGRLKNLQNDAVVPMSVARQIDTILTQCKIDRYLFLGGNGPQPFGYTTHSPLGPIFNQFPTFFESTQTFFRDSFIQSLHSSYFIVLDALQMGDLAQTTNEYIITHFTTTPWPCAGQNPFHDHYTFYYRSNWELP